MIFQLFKLGMSGMVASQSHPIYPGEMFKMYPPQLKPEIDRPIHQPMHHSIHEERPSMSNVRAGGSLPPSLEKHSSPSSHTSYPQMHSSNYHSHLGRAPLHGSQMSGTGLYGLNIN